MIVVLEGLNASGKSTLSLALQKHFRLNIQHPGPRPLTDSHAIENCEEQLKLNNVLLDRITCISRLAYEDPDSLCLSHYIKLLQYLRNMKKICVFIHCTGTGEHVLKSYYTNGHIIKITKDRDIIRDRYFKLFKRIKHFNYDFNKNSLEEVYEYIESCKR